MKEKKKIVQDKKSKIQKKPKIEENKKARCIGKVKWYNPKKRYGFIAVEGQPDVFFHKTGIRRGFLVEGDIVEFDIVDGEKGKKAVNIVKKNS